MCYMMSKQGYAGDSVEHWPAHLMFFYSQTDLDRYVERRNAEAKAAIGNTATPEITLSAASS